MKSSNLNIVVIFSAIFFCQTAAFGSSNVGIGNDAEVQKPEKTSEAQENISVEGESLQKIVQIPLEFAFHALTGVFAYVSWKSIKVAREQGTFTGALKWISFISLTSATLALAASPIQTVGCLFYSDSKVCKDGAKGLLLMML